MNPRIRAQAGALLSMIVLFYVLYRFVYVPVAGATMPGWVALVVTCLVATCFLDWVNRSLRDPVRAAVIIAISQVIITNVYGWLKGGRGTGGGDRRLDPAHRRLGRRRLRLRQARGRRRRLT